MAIHSSLFTRDIGNGYVLKTRVSTLSQVVSTAKSTIEITQWVSRPSAWKPEYYWNSDGATGHINLNGQRVATTKRAYNFNNAVDQSFASVKRDVGHDAQGNCTVSIVSGIHDGINFHSASHTFSYSPPKIQRYAKVLSKTQAPTSTTSVVATYKTDYVISKMRYKIGNQSWSSYFTKNSTSFSQEVTGIPVGYHGVTLVELVSRDSGLVTTVSENFYAHYTLPHRVNDITPIVGARIKSSWVRPNANAYSEVTFKVKETGVALNSWKASNQTGNIDVEITAPMREEFLNATATVQVATVIATTNVIQPGYPTTSTTFEFKATVSDVAPEVLVKNVVDVNGIDVEFKTDKFVQNMSSITVNFQSVKASQGSTLEAVAYSFSGRSGIIGNIVSQNLGLLPLQRDGTLSLTATDKRGLKGSTSVPIPVIPFDRPVLVKGGAARKNGYEEASYLDLEVRFNPVPSRTGIPNNELTLSYRYRELPSGAWSAPTRLSPTKVTTPSAQTTSAFFTQYVRDFDKKKDIEFELTFKNSVSSSFDRTETVIMSKGTALLKFEGDKATFGVDVISEETFRAKKTITADKGFIQGGRDVVDFNSQPVDIKKPIDFNNYWKHGVYNFSDNAGVIEARNRPEDAMGRLEVYTRFDYSKQSAPMAWQYVSQRYITFYGREYTRNGGTGATNNFSWGNWEETVRKVESKRTPDGIYEKWSDGKLVQRGLTTFTNGTTQAYGGVFRSETVQRVSFPIPFKVCEDIQMTTNGSGAFGVGYNSNNNEHFTARLIHYVSQTVNVDVAWVATGTWK